MDKNMFDERDIYSDADVKSIAEMLKEKLRAEMDEVKVSVALFGHSGAGKSSIINKLVGKDVAEVGVETDTTTGKAQFEWENLIITDLPGYNTKAFPKETYFSKFSILTDYDIFLCVFEGKLSTDNVDFFKELKRNGKVCIFVRNKIDSIYQPNKTLEQACEDIEKDLLKQIESYKDEVVFVSCKDNVGFDTLQKKIYERLDQSKRVRWAESSKSYSLEFLEIKRKKAERLVLYYAGLSAASGLNPIPGLDIAVDVGTIYGLFVHLRNLYGLTDAKIEKYKPFLTPTALQLSNNIIKFATKEGALYLLKRYATNQSVKQVSKYIPLVGQAIAASAGFFITKSAGNAFLDDCHNLAKEILKEELKI